MISGKLGIACVLFFVVFVYILGALMEPEEFLKIQVGGISFFLFYFIVVSIREAYKFLKNYESIQLND